MSETKTHPMSLEDGLAILFIALKLCGVIEWSWWWVTAPIWGSILFGAVYTVATKEKE